MTKRNFTHGSKHERLRKAQERLGRTDAKCLLCMTSNPHSLQLHHLAGREYADDVGPICNNHHARLSDAFRDHPTKIAGCTNSMEGVGHFLLGIAELALIVREDLGEHPLMDCLTLIETKLRAFGFQIIEMARANVNRGMS